MITFLSVIVYRPDKTRDFLKIISILQSVKNTSYRVFIRKPAGRKADWDTFLMPFSPRLWLALVATILFITLYLSTFYSIGRRVGNEEEGGPELYTFYDSILYIFGAFCQQG
jgi:hypothetical protein